MPKKLTVEDLLILIGVGQIIGAVAALTNWWWALASSGVFFIVSGAARIAANARDGGTSP